MAIQRWDPLKDLRELQQKMNRLFEESFARSGATEGVASLTVTGWQPPTDLIEEDDRYLLRCDLPGVAAADVQVRIEGGALFLRGERRPDKGVSRDSYLRVERPSGPFAVKIALAPSVDARRVRASQRNGVLEIVMPKKKAEAASQVEVAAGEA